MNSADRWLHLAWRGIGNWRDAGPEAVAEPREKALAGVDALEVAGVVPAAAAGAWRAVYVREAGGEQHADAGPELRERGERLLAALLDAVPDDDAEEFRAALDVLAAAGAVDADAWDAKLRERLGHPSAEDERALELARNAGGTQVDLAGVLAGPPDVHGGYRLLLVLRFADGVAFLVEQLAAEEDDWPQWRLTDDLGTPYEDGAVGSGHVAFRTPIPAAATWIELTLEGYADVVFRVRLD